MASKIEETIIIEMIAEHLSQKEYKPKRILDSIHIPVDIDLNISYVIYIMKDEVCIGLTFLNKSDPVHTISLADPDFLNKIVEYMKWDGKNKNG
jgi:hypothetical protein